eukprot:6439198-Pyramimonas_sp.AAC.1
MADLGKAAAGFPLLVCGESNKRSYTKLDAAPLPLSAMAAASPDGDGPAKPRPLPAKSTAAHGDTMTPQ